MERGIAHPLCYGGQDMRTTERFNKATCQQVMQRMRTKINSYFELTRQQLESGCVPPDGSWEDVESMSRESLIRYLVMEEVAFALQVLGLE